MPRYVWPLAGLLVVVAAAAFMWLREPASADDRAMLLIADPSPLVAETASGPHSFTIEIADESSERERGLMFRQDMDDDHGMLFVFPETKEAGFWMKNTPMPLDLIFIGEDGRVRGILPGEPFSEAVISPGKPVRFVLELKRGTADKAGIKDGDLLRHPAIDATSGAGNGG